MWAWCKAKDNRKAEYQETGKQGTFVEKFFLWAVFNVLKTTALHLVECYDEASSSAQVEEEIIQGFHKDTWAKNGDHSEFPNGKMSGIKRWKKPFWCARYLKQYVWGSFLAIKSESLAKNGSNFSSARKIKTAKTHWRII